MQRLLELLLDFACSKKASDIHLTSHDDQFDILLRTDNGFTELKQDIFDHRLIEYLKFVSGMDLCSPHKPQSGSFRVTGKREYSSRFALLSSGDLTTGVIRLLNTAADLCIEDLTRSGKSVSYLKQMTFQEHGLIISAGPTGSGKTTTLHAILHEMALRKDRKIVSLEDPVEIRDPNYTQLEINEAQGFSYERGIEELMRHDPDVILIGECRSAFSAKMAVRAALTGHLVFTTLHSGTAEEAIRRMLEFGVDEKDLSSILQAVFAQRLYRSAGQDSEQKGPPASRTGKECIYERWKRNDIENYFKHRNFDSRPQSLQEEIESAVQNGWIEKPVYIE